MKTPTIRTLTLDETTNPFPELSEAAHLERIPFPSGCEPHVRVKPIVCYPDQPDEVIISTLIRDGNDLIQLFVATDAVRRHLKPGSVSAFIPFVPHARQDRVAAPGDALSAKVIADLINLQGYSRVFVFDPHSDVMPALLNNCVTVLPDALWLRVIGEHEQVDDRITLVIPDAGATKRMNNFRRRHIIPHYELQAMKHRDPKTGMLIIEVPDTNLTGRTCIIFDDICDGGGTFIPLAQQLRAKGARRIVLVVSHGLFTKGTATLLQHIDEIHTTDSFAAKDPVPHLTVHTDLWPSMINL